MSADLNTTVIDSAGVISESSGFIVRLSQAAQLFADKGDIHSVKSFLSQISYWADRNYNEAFELKAVAETAKGGSHEHAQ